MVSMTPPGCQQPLSACSPLVPTCTVVPAGLSCQAADLENQVSRQQGGKDGGDVRTVCLRGVVNDALGVLAGGGGRKSCQSAQAPFQLLPVGVQ